MLDLYTNDEISTHLAGISDRSSPSFDLPFLAAKVGPGMPWPTLVSWHDRHPVPCMIANGEQSMILVRLAADRDMDYTTDGFNIAVLDPADREPSPEVLYAVDRGPDTVLRRVRPGQDKLYLVTDEDLNHPLRWEQVPLPVRGDLFRGRVRWLGRERLAKSRT
ncbi:MAG: hypothetical protein ACR2NN_04060 [Bryobacteraceae bacterium]